MREGYDGIAIRLYAPSHLDHSYKDGEDLVEDEVGPHTPSRDIDTDGSKARTSQSNGFIKIVGCHQSKGTYLLLKAEGTKPDRQKTMTINRATGIGRVLGIMKRP